MLSQILEPSSKEWPKAMVGGKKGRKFSLDGAAIRTALLGPAPEMKQLALKYVYAETYDAPAPATMAARLGIALSTYQNWMVSIPEIAHLHGLRKPRSPVEEPLGAVIQAALKSSYEDMRELAFRTLVGIIQEEEGVTEKIAERLGIAYSTYRGWIANRSGDVLLQQVRELHYAAKRQ